MKWVISIFIGLIIFLGILEITLFCYFIAFVRDISKEITYALDDDEDGEGE